MEPYLCEIENIKWSGQTAGINGKRREKFPDRQNIGFLTKVHHHCRQNLPGPPLDMNRPFPTFYLSRGFKRFQSSDNRNTSFKESEKYLDRENIGFVGKSVWTPLDMNRPFPTFYL